MSNPLTNKAGGSHFSQPSTIQHDKATCQLDPSEVPTVPKIDIKSPLFLPHRPNYR